jgi:MoxR-like ATPase
MKPSKLYEALHALIGERVPLHIWGACGVGKSQIVHQVADDLDYDFLDVRAVQLDPVDLRGLPRIAADQTEWVPPKFLPTTGKGIIFLDELTSAPQMTQAGCYQLVLDRKLGEYLNREGTPLRRSSDWTRSRSLSLNRVRLPCSLLRLHSRSTARQAAP